MYECDADLLKLAAEKYEASNVNVYSQMCQSHIL